MAATNIFYRLPSQRGTRIASIAGTECTLDQFCNYIIDCEGLNRQDFIIASGTKVFRPNSCSLQTISLQNNSHIDILIPLLGGKGGFGSLLRAIGAQIEKTTNRDACRDLGGRRLRDIKREEELKKLLELKDKLEEEKRQRKKEKLEKLKRQSEKSKASASIQELVSMFDDHAFNQRRMEIGDILDAAVEKGLINAKKRNLEQNQTDCEQSVKKSKPDSEKEDQIEVGAVRRTEDILIGPAKSESALLTSSSGRNIRKHDIWLGLDDDGEEEEEGDDDDDAKDSEEAEEYNKNDETKIDDNDLQEAHCSYKIPVAQR